MPLKATMFAALAAVVSHAVIALTASMPRSTVSLAVPTLQFTIRQSRFRAESPPMARFTSRNAIS